MTEPASLQAANHRAKETSASYELKTSLNYLYAAKRQRFTESARMNRSTEQRARNSGHKFNDLEASLIPQEILRNSSAACGV